MAFGLPGLKTDAGPMPPGATPENVIAADDFNKLRNSIETPNGSNVTATGGASKSLADWMKFIIDRSPSPVVGTAEVISHVLPTTGPAWGSIYQSFNNPAPQAATQNHGVWTGWNAGRHTGGSDVVAGKPSLIMGFEDNYYDTSGDGRFGMEWYIEYWSPDGTSQQMLRPFYTRIACGDNTKSSCITVMGIGGDGTGQFTVQALTDQLLYIDAVKTMVYKPFTSLDTTEAINSSTASVVFKGGAWVDKSLLVSGSLASNKIVASTIGAGAFAYDATFDRMTLGILPSLPASSIGAYVGWANGVAGTLTGDLLLIPRTDIGGAIRFFTGIGTPAKVFELGPAAVGFFGAAAVAKPTVTGSRGANAALASLLTALSGLGLLTDSSS